MEQYMRLQRGESADAGLARSGAGLHVHQVTPQRGGVQPPHRPGPQGGGIPIPPSNAAAVPVQVSPPVAPSSVRSRITQLAARNGAHFREAGVRLDVLVSERFLEEQAHATGEIAGTYGINLVDCPLEEPLSFILDATTAVCVLSVDAVTDRTQLKVLVKQLTSITFKFAKIYIMLTLERDVDCNSAVLQLCQTLMRFPAQAMLCQCTASPTAVAQMTHQLCRHCMRDCCAAGPDATTAKYLHRPFINHLQRAEGNFLSHCEYLQRFPTVNFFLACALLHHFPLRDLLRQTPAALCSYLHAQHVCTGETEVMVASFLQLVGTHAGLGACI
jgi:ribosomal protein S14